MDNYIKSINKIKNFRNSRRKKLNIDFIRKKLIASEL